MAKFQFRLDSLLKLKEELKRQSEMELASVRFKRMKSEEDLKLTIQTKNDVWSKSNSQNNRQVFQYQADYLYIKALEKEIDVKIRKIQRIKKIEDQILQEILKLDKSKKTIEKLKERRKEEYVKEMNRKEQIFLDDISQKVKSLL